LSSIDSAGVAPMLARFVTAKLLMTAARVERRTQVYLVIDEFQRMAAQSLEYLLQLSRSLGIGVILSNQSMEDLNLPGSRLVSSIESNCRYRQWFGVTSVEDRKRIKELAGETIELFKTETDAIASDGKSTSSVAWSETVVPRINGNEIWFFAF
jgi:type IV secretory pathway TraG/TraD family ATPase VirD4